MYLQTTTPLANGEIYDSGPKGADRTDRITGLVFSDQNGTLYIEQSSDGENWDLSKDIAVTANTGQGFSEEILASTLRIRFENDSGSDQTEFRLSAKSASAGDS